MVNRMLRHSIRALSWLAVTSLLVTDYVASGVRPEIATVASWRASTSLIAAEIAAPEPAAATAPSSRNLLAPENSPPASRWLTPMASVDLSKFDAVVLPMELVTPPETSLIEHWDDVSLTIPLGKEWTFDMAYRHGENDTVFDSMGHPIFGSLAGTVQNVEPSMENFVVGFRLNF
jgi:hypothetical protein